MAKATRIVAHIIKLIKQAPNERANTANTKSADEEQENERKPHLGDDK
jgi:hypothetical protein